VLGCRLRRQPALRRRGRLHHRPGNRRADAPVRPRMHRRGGLPPPRRHLNKPFAPRSKAARCRTVALDVTE